MQCTAVNQSVEMHFSSASYTHLHTSIEITQSRASDYFTFEFIQSCVINITFKMFYLQQKIFLMWHFCPHVRDFYLSVFITCTQSLSSCITASTYSHGAVSVERPVLYRPQTVSLPSVTPLSPPVARQDGSAVAGWKRKRQRRGLTAT